jgi:hypothetical protein
MGAATTTDARAAAAATAKNFMMNMGWRMSRSGGEVRVGLLACWEKYECDERGEGRLGKRVTLG